MVFHLKEVMVHIGPIIIIKCLFVHSHSPTQKNKITKTMTITLSCVKNYIQNTSPVSHRGPDSKSIVVFVINLHKLFGSHITTRKKFMQSTSTARKLTRNVMWATPPMSIWRLGVLWGGRLLANWLRLGPVHMYTSSGVQPGVNLNNLSAVQAFILYY